MGKNSWKTHGLHQQLPMSCPWDCMDNSLTAPASFHELPMELGMDYMENPWTVPASFHAMMNDNVKHHAYKF